MIRQTAAAIRDLPGEIMLGIEARAELARARQTMRELGWANFGRPHSDDVAELAQAWARAERESVRYRRALEDIDAGCTSGVDRATEALR